MPSGCSTRIIFIYQHEDWTLELWENKLSIDSVGESARFDVEIRGIYEKNIRFFLSTRKVFFLSFFFDHRWRISLSLSFSLRCIFLHNFSSPSCLASYAEFTLHTVDSINGIIVEQRLNIYKLEEHASMRQLSVLRGKGCK